MGYVNSQIGETSQTTSETVGPPGPRGDIGPTGPQGPIPPEGRRLLEGRPVHRDPKGKMDRRVPKGWPVHRDPRTRWTAGSKRRPEGSGPEASASGAADIDMQNKYDILRLKSNPYPIHSDLTKVINYQDTKDIFLSK